MAKNEQPKAAAAAAPEAPKAEKAKFVPKVLKNVTLPILKLEIGIPVYVKPTGAMFIGKDITAREKDPLKKKAPATITEVINLETGELCQLLVPSVLKGIWEDDYTEWDNPADFEKRKAVKSLYIGKGFMLEKQEKRAGKEYFPFSVSEIEV
jgi:hypothetical protein